MFRRLRIRSRKIRVAVTNPFTEFIETALNLFRGRCSVNIFVSLFSMFAVHMLEEADFFLLFLNIENNVDCTLHVSSTLAEIVLLLGQIFCIYQPFYHHHTPHGLHFQRCKYCMQLSLRSHKPRKYLPSYTLHSHAPRET